MLPTKDAAFPLPGQPETPTTRATDAPRPPGSAAPVSAGAPVASQRPSHPHASHQGHGPPHTGGHGSHGSSHGSSHGPSHGTGPSRREGGRETKSAGSPNIQDVFLNYARREKLTVVIQLLDGQAVEGRIKNFDRFALIIDHAGVDHLVFKHAIATIRSPRSIGSYYASHEAS
jgi:host factor-I protein